jgi:hypothetical protein
VTPQQSAEHKPAQPAAVASAAPADMTEAEIIAKVDSLMLLPQGETPTLAKVTDLAALSGQIFFAHAKVGDIVLMYSKASRAVLYDPAVNKIIEVGPIQNATSTAPIKE